MAKLNNLQSLGQHIYVYNNIRTNQVLYSLTRVLRNKQSLRQLPFVGKKTVPAALRKDLWQPMATISFPNPPQGREALHKLREYRKLHELSYPLEDFKSEKSEHALLEKKKRPRWLMNQKANSIADIAAVLQRQEDKEKAMQQSNGGEETSVEGVRISWRNILDAEYAESWPGGVVHDGLDYSRHTAPAPIREA